MKEQARAHLLAAGTGLSCGEAEATRGHIHAAHVAVLLDPCHTAGGCLSTSCTWDRAAFGEEKDARTARGRSGPFKGRCQHRVPTEKLSPREAQAPCQVPAEKPQGCQVCTPGCPFRDGSSAPTINTSPDHTVPSGSLRSSSGCAKTSRREAP